jgi:hypothetical protein
MFVWQKQSWRGPIAILFSGGTQRFDLFPLSSERHCKQRLSEVKKVLQNATGLVAF